MQKLFSFALLLFISFSVFSQSKISVIPRPVSVVENSGEYVLPKSISVSAPVNAALRSTVDILRKKLSVATGYQTVSSTTGNAAVNLILNKTADKALGDEGYKLSVNNAGVKIVANKPAGIFNGAQTLLQLLPAEIESGKQVKNISWSIPHVEITDYPQMKWRGLMLDVSRHFFTVDEIKGYIDQMAKYKLNTLHWHLTDDEGWRVEIKSYPKLTSVGAWRVPMEGNFGQFPAPGNEPKTYGGFYTQEQVKDIVKYAQERFINIVPEVDMPGHSMAIIAAYPELSCTSPLPQNYQVRAGESFIDWNTHTLHVDNTLCPANEKVYSFINDVVRELAQLFPYEYLHIGGDEAFYTFWEKSDAVKQLMKRENLKTYKEVQGYFGRRVEKIVNSYGKKAIGWDEVLETGVNKSTAIMAWRGNGDHGIKASNLGHKVIMSPAKYTYIDYMQGDKVTEPLVYASLRLNEVYKFNPTPAGANAANILGGQANLWTEQIYNIRQVQYMTWPRGFALAESVWSPQQSKNWKDFVRRTEDHFNRLNFAKVKYSPAIYDPVVKVRKAGKGKIAVELVPEIDGLDIHYTFDNSTPDNYYPKYTQPLTFPTGAEKLHVITYKRGEDKPAGRLLILTLEDLTKRAK